MILDVFRHFRLPFGSLRVRFDGPRTSTKTARAPGAGTELRFDASHASMTHLDP